MDVLSGQDIHRTLTRSAGSRSWQDARTAARELADDLADQAATMNRLLTGMESTWSGAASDVARQGGQRLAAEVATAADALDVTQDVLDRQVNSWHAAVHGVVPVPDPPTPANPVQGLADGDPTHHQRWQRVLDAARNNVTVYQNYQAASAEYRALLPVDYGDQPGRLGAGGASTTAGGAPRGSWAPEPMPEDERPGPLPEGVHGTVTSDIPATIGGAGRGRRGGGRAAGRRTAAVPAIRGARVARRASGHQATEPPTDAAGYLEPGTPGPFGIDDGSAPPVIGG
ncbi:MAG TPA: PPE domain-containing protein [Pseudonocardiaceae bacterium]|jgi:ABC-type transporter Mla subunit MlaD|nr:PPE domain-containing protein [Pseudonocardiaceae bacterium]